MSTINVNLKPCDCGQRGILAHASACSATPIPIHCPIQRTVTVTVRLGECTCPGGGRPPEGHWQACPYHPIRVTCSISGKTWEKSEVTDAWPERDDGYLCSTGEEFPTLIPICRERWGLVKALVLGMTWGACPPEVSALAERMSVGALFTQRDAVFSALADMARAERTIIQGMASIDKVHTNRKRQPFRGVVADELTAYVEHIIEQVGGL